MHNIFKKNSTVVVLLLVLIAIVVAGFWYKKPILTNPATGKSSKVKNTDVKAPESKNE